MSSTVALVSDMIFASRIRSTATQLGATCAVVTKVESLVREVGESAPHTVLIDLQCESADPIEAIAALAALSDRPRIVGFCSHVAVQRMADGREAGADEVLARSAFVQRLTAILAGESENV